MQTTSIDNPREEDNERQVLAAISYKTQQKFPRLESLSMKSPRRNESMKRMKRSQFIRAKIEAEQRNRRHCIIKLMEQTGVTDVCSKKPAELEWYRDARAAPSSQAAYLGKLAKLRKELLDQEKGYLSKTLHRLQETEDHLVQEHRYSALNLPNNTPRATQSTPRESIPERHKRLLADRKHQIEIRRIGHSQPTLKGLVGRSLTSLSSEGNVATKEADPPEDALSWDALTSLVKQQTNRLPTLDDCLKPQHSIPNIGRRALDNPDLPLAHEESDTFIRQMSIHEKDSKGLYKGRKRRNLMAADKDEVDLSPHTFRFDVPGPANCEKGKNRRAIHPGTMSLVTPNPTMVNQKLQMETQKHHIKRYFNPRQVGYTPARVMYLQPDSLPIRSFPNNPRPMLLSIPVQQEILSQYRKHTRHVGILSEVEKMIKQCLFCQNPTLSMVSIGLGQYIMTHIKASSPEDLDQQRKSPGPPPQSPEFEDIINLVGDVNSVNGTPRTGLKVELPDVGIDSMEEKKE